MKTPITFALFFAAIITSLSTQAVVIVEIKNVTLEGASLEILHNPETGAGTIIARESDCDKCKPVSLGYSKPLSFSINGVKEVYTGDSPKLGQGDISYDPEELTVDHLNLYQE
ncbi:MAG: hypothetical protein AseanaTS_25940 [Candidatus Pelagadaptatus aseana]|uniref:hypothetical protein n=1 Tax=Candidatus Pelagadaptatus aseana TaxID=3120508 RepID=UPI0039B2AA42